MKDAILIDQISTAELRELFRGIVQQENEELRKEVALLREEIRLGRRVITHRQAIHYFDSRVTSETILEYIWWCGLPASKRGRLWFIQIEDLYDWLLGKIGFESAKTTGIKRISPPRHLRNVNARSSSGHSRLARHGEKESVPTDARELNAQKNRHH
ncbi:MAG: hypothetical protein IH951_08395 [Bacteroidetes bacterium]|nr:hypothetical protein [Bacteroidota bacterium]